MSLSKEGEYCWFSSGSRLGNVFIGIRADEPERRNLSGPHKVFQQAALVSSAELFIQAIEIWQQLELDLIPCREPSNREVWLELSLKPPGGRAAESAGSDESLEFADLVSHTKAENTERRIVLVMAVDAIPELRPISSELDAVLEVSGPALGVRVMLDEFAISSDELRAVNTGAAIVLPRSFDARWQVAVGGSLPGTDALWAGELTVQERSIAVALSYERSAAVGPPSDNNSHNCDPAEKEIASQHKVQVWCAPNCEVTLADIFGTQQDNQIAVNTDRIGLHVDGKQCAVGSLLQYGRGQLLTVTEMGGAAEWI